jgi:hypothetical protein
MVLLWLFLTPQSLIWGAPFCSRNMVSSAKLALFAFSRSMQSIGLGRNLKAFILRCVLLWPRILRGLRKFWSLYFQTSSRDEKKTKGDTGWPSPPGTSRKREECMVVCASQDFGGVGGPSRHSISGSSNEEQSIQLENVIPRTPSVPHSLSSSYVPSPQGSPTHSATRLRSESPRISASSSRAESPHGAVELFIQPVSWTHPRATGRQFTGASSRSPSRPSSPFRRLLSRPNTPTRSDIEIPIRLDTIQHSQGSPEDSTSEVPIHVEQPSRSPTPEDTESMYSTSHPRLPPVDGRTQSFPTPQSPSAESVNSSAASSHSTGYSFSMSGVRISAHHSGGYSGFHDSTDVPSSF